MTIKLITFLIMVLVIAVPVYAVELGTFGLTYHIAERDVMEQIQEKIDKTDWTKMQEKIREDGRKHIINYRPRDLKNLPVATRNDSFSVDMTWTLPFDIPDGKGGVIYPKGFTFNPLAHVYYTRTLVFIDASDKRQVDWLVSSPFLKKMTARIMLTGGSYYDFMKKHKRHVFYANSRILDRLGIRAVPSVAVQQGTVMVIHEYDPDQPLIAKKGKRKP